MAMNPDVEAEGRDEAEQGSDRRTGGAHQLADEAYIRRVRRWWKDSSTKENEVREEEDEDFRFVAGNQWDQEDKEQLKRERRPCLTLNYVLPVVSSICGEERLNRQEIKVYGRDQSDDPGAHAMSELIRWVMDDCNGDYAISRAYRSGVIGGRGWTHVRVDYLDDPNGTIRVEQVKRNEIYLDPTSEREDASDARFLIREKWLTEDEIEALWPDKLEEIKKYAEGQREEGIGVESTPRGDAYSAGGDRTYRDKDGTYQVLEVWHHEVVAGAIALNPDTGLLEEVTKDQLTALLTQQEEAQGAYDQAEQIATAATQQGLPVPPEIQQPLMSGPPEPLQYTERPIKRFYQGFVCGDVVLERNEAPVKRLKRFPYVPFFGIRDEDKDRWFGVVRMVKDPQRQHNVEQSAILHWTQTSPKNGWMAPKGGFHDRRRWEQKSSQAGFIGEYNPSRGKPEQIKPAPLPRHLVEMAQSRLANIREISGANAEIMGNTVKDTPGVVLELRRKQALTVLQTFFDNLSLTRRVLGEVLIRYIQEYVADGRQVRVLGPNGPSYVQATQDLAMADYDAVVDDVPDSPTDKMATMHILQTTLPMMMKAGIPIPPSFVDILPIPPHVRDEWKMFIGQMMGGGGPQGPGGPSPQGPPPGGPPQGQ